VAKRTLTPNVKLFEVEAPAVARKARPGHFVILRVHEKGERIPMEVKENDRVLFSKYAGNEIKIDGVEYLIMREDDILAILED